MFKKGMRPHNKGDTYVHANYRNRPRMRDDYDRDDTMERKIMHRDSNPFRIHITAHDLSTSKNNLRSNRVDLF